MGGLDGYRRREEEEEEEEEEGVFCTVLSEKKLVFLGGWVRGWVGGLRRSRRFE